MKLKRFSQWYKGLFKKAGTEARIADEALLKVNNVDVDMAGRMTTRTGYIHSPDLETNGSITSGDSEPNVVDTLNDFINKVQGLYHFTDVVGVHYVFAVTNGKVYAEMKDGNDKVWVLLNPVGVINFVADRAKEIKVVSYLDSVFFNDVENNVYMYNSQQYNEGGWIITGNRFIYFANDTIYIRNYSDFSSNSEDIVIENVAANLNGKRVYDSLDAINFDNEVNLATELNFGYAIRAGNRTTGYFYYVLSNGKNEAANDDCYIVKFNERFIAKDYVKLDMNANGEVVNFGYYNGDIYLWCIDGRIEVLDEDALTNTPITTNDVADFVAPSYDGGTTKQYALTVNEKGIFVYTMALPTKTDWWQPLFLKDFVFDDSSDPGFTESTLTTGYTRNWKFVVGRDAIDNIDIEINTTSHLSEIATSTGVKYGVHSWITFGYYLSAQFHFQTGLSYGGAHPDSRWNGPTAPGTWGISTDAQYSQGKQYGPSPSNPIPSDKWPGDTGWSHAYGDGQTPVDFNNNIAYHQGNVVNESNIPSRSKLPIISFKEASDIFPEQYPRTNYTVAGNRDIGWNYFSSPTAVEVSDNNYTVTRGTKIDIDDITVAYTVTPEDNNLDLTERKVSNLEYFGYDKNGSMLTDIQIWNDLDVYELKRDTETNFFYLKGSSHYNTTIFSSQTASNNVLLVGVDTSGNLLEEEYADADDTDVIWRWVIPLGKEADLKNILPLQTIRNGLGEDIIYFGTSMDDGSNGQDNGYYTSLNITTFEVNHTELKKADKMMYLQGDFLNRWWIRKYANSDDQIRIGDTWDWDTGIHQWPAAVSANAYTDYMTFNSNLTFHLLKIVQDTPLVEIDQLKPLGVPKQPQLTMDNDDLNPVSTFTKDDTYRYYTAYEFLDGSTTDLSPVSEEFVIPDLGVAGAEPVKIVLSGLNLNNAQGTQIYATADISKIQIYRAKKAAADADFGEPLFLAELEKDGNNDWYYFETAQTFPNTDVNDDGGGDLEVTLAAHGYLDGEIVRFSTTGTLPTGLAVDTNYYIVNKAAGTFEVSLTSGGTPVTYTDQGSGTHSVWMVYAEETYEDNVGTITYNPFTRANVQTYPCKDMVVHKNRLVLINKTNEINSNVIHYSSTTVAEALDPDNIRPIGSGDGDALVAGISVGDYLYLFKEFHIYAILGDVATGQPIDIAHNIGTLFWRTPVVYNKVVYFMNRFGVFKIEGPRAIEIKSGSLDDLFDENLTDSIDFENCPDNAFGYVDTKNKEVHFNCPRKIGGNSQTQNNLDIVYDIRKNLFKTRTYYDPFFKRIASKDVVSGARTELVTNYTGNIFEMDDVYTDNLQDIDISIWLKSFNADIDMLRKYFNFIKVFGKNIDDITLSYDIDGVVTAASVTNRSIGDRTEGLALITNCPGHANRIIVKIEGTPPAVALDISTEDTGYDVITESTGEIITTEDDTVSGPIEFDEFLLGYEPLKGVIH